MVYVMCAVPLPPGVISQVDRRRRGFLWAGEGAATGGQCLVAWEQVCDDKALGGLGVKDLALQNTCLLLKLIHRLHTATDSSWADWVRSNVSLATLEGEVAGGHWEVLRGLFPLFQAITTLPCPLQSLPPLSGQCSGGADWWGGANLGASPFSTSKRRTCAAE
ncbi:hypothetical protein U9M48_034630 [Paspalum notatum var. saurae]|uniref:Uncharacterized protein n=1 Tax=Paspalum notatum var. saurae TaxID=547442 RepID=A0AAQ3X938_PASNO